jgi:type III restriction enzyme
MKLKDYQEAVIAKLERVLTCFAAERAEAEEFIAFQRSKGKTVAGPDWCRTAWDALAAEGALPAVRQADDTLVTPGYIARTDGLGRPIPNLCVKVPTGGGKTLLGCAALETLLTVFAGRQTGLVLWVIPTDAIFRQTWKAFANRESGYRQRLERASGGKIKLLRKDDAFTREDTETHLCVMLIMLQAGAVREDSKDKRKLNQDSGRYPSFFPEVDDEPKNAALWKAVPNLDRVTMDEDDFRADQIIVRQSLNNVFRLLRPLVVMDEGHKAYGKASFEFLTGFNPSFILELSATPNSGAERLSNVVVNVTGTALQQEQMIKLPISLINDQGTDWKSTLESSVEKLDELQKAARKLRGDTNRHIRPILLVRVERTGKDQRDKTSIHAEDAREYLVAKLGAKPEEIRVKSSETDELGDEDLLAETCPVRFIITKDALREGWDCPFAYVLAVLSRTTAKTAITQMIGRVLRQPEARRTGIPALDQCYVFTFDQEVSAAVAGVQAGLADEGMGDLADQIQVGNAKTGTNTRSRTIHRAKKFSGVRVFLPRVLAKDAKGALRTFDYDRDLLSRVDWEALRFSARDTHVLGDAETYARTVTAISVATDAGKTKFTDATSAPEAIAVEDEWELAPLVRLLGDVVPNPWQASRILEDAVAGLRARGINDAQIQTHRLSFVQAIRVDLRRQVNEATESIFRELLKNEQVTFRLEATNDPKLNWELAETLTINVATNDHTLERKDGLALERHLFEVIYQKELNGLERNLAWYLDAEKAVSWWHRIAVRQDWHLQGWQRQRVYPDFLVCLEQASEEEMRFLVLETKGLHLKGNDDTEYKRRLFDLLTAHSASALSAGEIKLGLKNNQLRFEMLLEGEWEQKTKAALKIG